jgi:hypothetical protein
VTLLLRRRSYIGHPGSLIARPRTWAQHRSRTQAGVERLAPRAPPRRHTRASWRSAQGPGRPPDRASRRRPVLTSFARAATRLSGDSAPYEARLEEAARPFVEEPCRRTNPSAKLRRPAKRHSTAARPLRPRATRWARCRSWCEVAAEVALMARGRMPVPTRGSSGKDARIRMRLGNGKLRCWRRPGESVWHRVEWTPEFDIGSHDLTT